MTALAAQLKPYCICLGRRVYTNVLHMDVVTECLDHLMFSNLCDFVDKAFSDQHDQGSLILSVQALNPEPLNPSTRLKPWCLEPCEGRGGCAMRLAAPQWQILQTTLACNDGLGFRAMQRSKSQAS